MRAVVGSVCFVCRDGKVLMLQRNHPPFQGKWDGLGGLVEFGESPEQGTVISSHLFVAEAPEGEVRGSEEGLPVWIPESQVQRIDLIDFMQVTLPLVLTPDSFLSGSIVHGASGEPISYDLMHHKVDGVSRYSRAAPWTGEILQAKRAELGLKPAGSQ